MIQKESDTNWREMYEVFNMGHRMDYVPADKAEKLSQLVKALG